MSCITRRVVAALLLMLLIPASWAGTLLVANKAEGTVTLLSSPGFEPLATLPVGQGPHEIALSPEGLRALVTNYGTREKPGNTLTLLDLARLRPVATIELPEGARPHGIAWPRPDTAVVTAEGLRALLLVDVPGGEVVGRIDLDQDVAHMVAASRDGKSAWVASIGSGVVTAVDLESGAVRASAAAGAGTEGIALVDGGNEVWVSNREAGTVSVFAAATLEKLADIEVGGFPIRVEADDERGRVYVTLAKADAMAVLDSRERKLLPRVPLAIDTASVGETLLSAGDVSGSIPVGLLLSRDGELLFIAHTNAHRVSVRDANSLEQLKVFTAGREPDGMAWTWMDLPLRQ
ncbi:YncE family protein [Parahaliea mediterranea]|uniref:YncE family protein n=1 Tax=Parahaliea mediterranea TaxID=651086 RepID=A0A939DEB7_9GAMM|nr:hypothetical protein [Parahaliea mediterranea]MBN7796673.1 hypothetical protein [Parahaliea mediterranea]